MAHSKERVNLRTQGACFFVALKINNACVRYSLTKLTFLKQNKYAQPSSLCNTLNTCYIWDN